MPWTPLSREELDAMLAQELGERDEQVRAAWARIAIEPARWRCSPQGDEGGGFWAVAVEDGEVLWFNDIEIGFNWSPSSAPGTIDEYVCDQRTFGHVLDGLERRTHEAAWSRQGLEAVPGALRGPGTIGRRQTTYWELIAAGGSRYRVHFRSKFEMRFAGAGYPGVEVLTRHPLLADHHVPSRPLYIAGAPLDPAAVASALEPAIRAASDGWRGLGDYENSLGARRILEAGHGVLLVAPDSIRDAASEVLQQAAVETYVLGVGPTRPDARVLLLGRSFVIANELAFEPVRDVRFTDG